ncbi:hypothetical protein [Actinoplanes sp. NBRC 103695]|uniref:hypothetical protein n=1 Tax=Actinoplanes sp. NBRC 103695 TaxID=3032202 RepID=UPI0024A56C02|nr:hypothetical protein [Actinoplanes sp. NBRC 103695]GLZ00234.1 hypothetical protein Acsp02_74860 [Actinoplanes sp. NBRC 103695]
MRVTTHDGRGAIELVSRTLPADVVAERVGGHLSYTSNGAIAQAATFAAGKVNGS